MAADTPLHEGLVVASHGRHAVVEALDGSRRICHPRGKKNQALVGDAILWQAPPAGQGEEGTIESILPRRNVFYRQDDIRTKAFAANIDRVLVWLAAEPDFSHQLLGHALIAAAEAKLAAGEYELVPSNSTVLLTPVVTNGLKLISIGKPGGN